MSFKVELKNDVSDFSLVACVVSFLPIACIRSFSPHLLIHAIHMKQSAVCLFQWNQSDKTAAIMSLECMEYHAELRNNFGN